MLMNDKWIRDHKDEIFLYGFCECTDEVEGERVISYGLSSYGYDLRLGHKFKLFPSSNELGINRSIIDPKNPHGTGGLHDPPYIEKTSTEPFCIEPHSFILGHTVEKIRMPDNVLGICVGKSTLARVGLIVNITPIEPSWMGHITIEISNTTPRPTKIYPYEGICQLLFLRGDRAEKTYTEKGTGKAKYMDQPATPVLPRM